MSTSPSRYHKILTKRIIELSVSKVEREAFSEWYVVTKRTEDGNGVCLCTKRNLINMYDIENKFNKNEAVIGSTCIERFMKEAYEEYNDQSKLLKKLEKQLEDVGEGKYRLYTIEFLIAFRQFLSKDDTSSYMAWIDRHGRGKNWTPTSAETWELVKTNTKIWDANKDHPDTLTNYAIEVIRERRKKIE